MSKPAGDVPVSVPPLDALMLEANNVAKAGQVEKAGELLKSAAASYPTGKEPWLKLAQMKFDSGSYGEAIINANEVLQRDPKDKVAHSLIAVSGLRLSTKALNDLRNQNELTGNVRTEAQELAKLLRESIGEAVLVPAPAKPALPATSQQRAVKRAARPHQTAPAVRPETGTGSGANPFGALK